MERPDWRRPGHGLLLVLTHGHAGHTALRARQPVVPVIGAVDPSPQRARATPPPRTRNVVERSFNLLKQWRGLATRYDKHAVIYRADAVLAAIVAWVRSATIQR